jgi:ADP-ribose pyrophosphatase YjhB (NUDIX family)
MKPEYAFHIRVTGILMENDQLLLVRQKVNEREWSLPGGRLEQGESLAQGMLREMKEETGLDTAIERMLYVCDVASSGNTVLHITFLLKRTGGTITLPTNEFDQYPIHEVRFVPVDELRNLGFSEEFVRLIRLGFPQAGNYMGDKTQIGL